MVVVYSSVVERRSLTGELSLACSNTYTIYIGKPSTVGQLTRLTQPFFFLGSIMINAAIRWLLSRLVAPSGERLLDEGRCGVFAV